MNNTAAHHAPLHPLDTGEQTVGCRHSHPSFCSKNRLPKVCALVRKDHICHAPPHSWKKRFLELTAGPLSASKCPFKAF